MSESIITIGLQPLIMAVTALVTLGVSVGMTRGRIEALRRDNDDLRERVSRLEKDLPPW